MKFCIIHDFVEHFELVYKIEINEIYSLILAINYIKLLTS